MRRTVRFSWRGLVQHLSPLQADGEAENLGSRLVEYRLISTITQKNTPEIKCGFRSNRGTVDMIFVLRQIQEKCRKQNIDLDATFVDLTKAFDTVSRDGLWKYWRALAAPANFSPSSASSMKVSKVR